MIPHPEPWTPTSSDRAGCGSSPHTRPAVANQSETARAGTRTARKIGASHCLSVNDIHGILPARNRPKIRFLGVAYRGNL